MGKSKLEMTWKMRGAATVMTIVFLVTWLQPLPVGLELTLLAVGLACAAWYTKMHWQLREQKKLELKER